MDEVSKEILDYLNIDDIMDPDLSEKELTSYYDELLKKATSEKNDEETDKILAILSTMIEGAKEDE